MKHNCQKDEGILLQVIPYLEHSSILKIFTSQGGLLTVITKKKGSLIPFCKGEWVLRKSQRDFFSLQDSSLIDPHHQLRSSYQAISAAGSIAHDLLRSQLPSQSSSSLYQLLVACFSHLSKNPEAIAQSFRLKLLQLEGILLLEQFSDPLFTEEELHLIQALGSAKRFSELESLSLTPHFSDKLKQFFFHQLAR